MTEKSYGGNNGVREHSSGKLGKDKSSLVHAKLPTKTSN